MLMPRAPQGHVEFFAPDRNRAVAEARSVDHPGRPGATEGEDMYVRTRRESLGPRVDLCVASPSDHAAHGLAAHKKEARRGGPGLGGNRPMGGRVGKWTIFSTELTR